MSFKLKLSILHSIFKRLKHSKFQFETQPKLLSMLLSISAKATVDIESRVVQDQKICSYSLQRRVNNPCQGEYNRNFHILRFSIYAEALA